MELFTAVIIVLVPILGVAGLLVPAIRWARKSSRRSAVFGLALELTAAGVNPHPPAQIQLDEAGQQARLKKASESGDPEL
jgi:Tfp pilus assembly protein PilV